MIRQLLQACIQTYQVLDPQMKHQRGLLAALRTCPDNLSPKRLQVRNNYLKQQPAISAIYDFKQQLYQLLIKMTMKAKCCKRYLPILLDMIQALKQSDAALRGVQDSHYKTGSDKTQRLVDTIQSANEPADSYRHDVNNSLQQAEEYRHVVNQVTEYAFSVNSDSCQAFFNSLQQQIGVNNAETCSITIP